MDRSPCATLPASSATDGLSNELVGLASGVLAVLGWGFTGVLITMLPGLSAWSIVEARFSVGLLCFVLCYSVLRRPWRCLVRHAASRPLWYSVAIMVVYYVGAVVAFQNLPVAEAALLMCLSPIAVIAGRAVTGQPVPSGQAVGALMAMIGLAVILVPPAMASDGAAFGNRWLGYGGAVMSAGLMAIYTQLLNKARLQGQPVDMLAQTWWLFLTGTVAMLPLVAFSHDGSFSYSICRVELPLILIALGGPCTLLPTFCYSVASSRLNPIVSTTLRLSNPLVSAIVAWLLLGQIPGWTFPGGAALVILGTALASWRPTHGP